MIPYGRQDINQADVDAVVEVLRSDSLTQGAVVPKFEQAVAAHVSAEHSVAVNSATSALHIACLALDLGPGDWLWTSPITFVASANCALYCGAQVDFVDIDPLTYNLSVEHLAKKLEDAERAGNLPKIVIPVHLCGQSCDMEGIYSLSRQYNFRIIEDASHAIGGKYKNKPIGNCLFSDITVFSFHPVKIITTGEGGMALTNNAVLADRMRRYRSHGVTTDDGRMEPRPVDEIWNYQQIGIGYNYRMTDIQAALGLSQMLRLREFVERRRYIAQRYDEELSNFPLRTPWQHPDCYSSFHLYPIRFDFGRIEKTQRRIYETLRAAGILVNLHYIPVYRQPYFEAMGFKENHCPQSESYYKEVVSLPMFPALTDSEQSRVINTLHEVLK
jgi:UDP-4-amino-4,6-dideoxy-N-acetyl-beta-L-altrosamine transaminase